MTAYYDLGQYSRPVTTKSADAQAWFDRGLNWCYGYNHDEAVRCFRKAAECDPSCAMTYWGVSYAAGPNYNKQWKAFDTIDLKRSLDTAHDAARRALEVVDGASSVEQALIRPLAQRYPSNDPDTVTPIWNDHYANGMREVYRAHGDDHDIAALFAEALMNRTPWQLWDIKEGKPLFCVTTAMIHYAKAVAHAASGNVAAAEDEARHFDAAFAKVPPSRYVFNNTCLDILAIAAEMMQGEIEYRKGHFDTAFAHLRKSVELDDNLPYDEPWAWMQPTRHALGALLLEQGRVEEAEAVYRADLGLDGTLARACQHPENVWSLHGFHECLMRLGKHAEARIIKQRLDIAAAWADVPIKSSCFCRMQTAA